MAFAWLNLNVIAIPHQKSGSGLSDTMKPLVELPIEHYESLLKRASENSPLYFRLKNAIKTNAGTIAILCDLDEAEMLLQVANHFRPDAVPQIERAIRLARFPL
jgi:hypothetical protein